MSVYDEKLRLNSLQTRRITHYMTMLAKDWDSFSAESLPQVEREVAPSNKDRARDSGPSIPDPWDVVHDAEPVEPPRALPPEPSPIDDEDTLFSQAGGIHLPAQASQAPQAPQAQSAAPPPDERHEAAGIQVERSPWQDEPQTVARLQNRGEDEGGDPPQELPEVQAAQEAQAAQEEEERPPQGEQQIPTQMELDDFDRAMAVFDEGDDFTVGQTDFGRAQSEKSGLRDDGMAWTAPASWEEEPTSSTEPQGVPLPVPRAVARRSEPKKSAQRVHPPRKKSWVPIIAVVLLLLLLAGALLWYFVLRERSGKDPLSIPVQGNAVMLDGVALGYVADAQALQDKFEATRAGVQSATGLPASYAKPLIIQPQWIESRYLAAQDAMERVVMENNEILVQAYGVYIDGDLVAPVQSEETVNEVIDEALAPYRQMAQSSRNIQDIGFAQRIEVRPVMVRPSDLFTRDQLYRYLVTGEKVAAGGKVAYEVVQGDSLSVIAQSQGLPLSQLRYANPDLIGRDLIRPGMQLSLEPPQGVLSIQFVEQVTVETTIKYGTVTKESASLYTNQQKVERKGERGQRVVVADRTYMEGVMAEEKVLSETITKEPVDEIVVKGTRKVTTYVWPTQGKLTSGFKERWGRMHKAIDIAAATGTPIYASRAGKVSFSGDGGTYGKMIKINHGDGVETRYAHCSKLVVSKGASVKKGQLIAYVGNTGNSTGPHLHFEIRVDGVAKDPQKYLP